MKLSEKIQEALREQQEINLSDPAVQKRLAAQWGYIPAGAQPAPSVPNLDMDALERQNDDLKAEVGRLRDALALIADQYEPKCSLLIPSIARTALNATGAYGQKESPESWPTEAMVTAFAELFNVRDQKNTFGPAFRAALAAAPEAKP